MNILTENVGTFADEAALQTFLNDGVIPPIQDLFIIAKGGQFTLTVKETTTPIISPAAAAVLARMVGLTQTEIDAIIQFVDAEVNANNWDEIDEFYCPCLSNVADRLQGWKQVTAVDNGGSFDLNGWTGNGVDQYLDSGFNPLNNGNRYGINNATIGGFIRVAPTLYTSRRCLIGAFDGTVRAFFQTDANQPTDLTMTLNSTQSGTTRDFVFENVYQDNQLQLAVANADTFRYYSIDGVRTPFRFGTPINSNIPNANFFIGANNNNGVANNFYEGTLSTIVIGGDALLDKVVHNTNVRQLLTSLGLTL